MDDRIPDARRVVIRFGEPPIFRGRYLPTNPCRLKYGAVASGHARDQCAMVLEGRGEKIRSADVQVGICTAASRRSRDAT